MYLFVGLQLFEQVQAGMGARAHEVGKPLTSTTLGVRITRPDGTSYRGHWVNGFPHGTGSLEWPNGLRLVGEFERGEPCGQGTLLLSQYTVTGRWQGQATCREAIVTASYGAGQLVGHVQDGRFLGVGQLRAKAFTATGQFALTSVWQADTPLHVVEGTVLFADQSVMTCQAYAPATPEIAYPDGRLYRGQVRRGRPHGQGVMRCPNGDSYCGFWVKGLRHGQGSYIQVREKAVYHGEWRCGRRHGPGELVMADGRKFGGTWDNDELCIA